MASKACLCSTCECTAQSRIAQLANLLPCLPLTAPGRPPLSQAGPDWEEILRYFRGSELQNYFLRVLEDNLKTVIKPQYVDHIPKAVRGNVSEVLDTKDQRGIKEELLDLLDLRQVGEQGRREGGLVECSSSVGVAGVAAGWGHMHAPVSVLAPGAAHASRCSALVPNSPASQPWGSMLHAHAASCTWPACRRCWTATWSTCLVASCSALPSPWWRRRLRTCT